MSELTQDQLNPGHYEANLVADSVNEAGHRLGTFVVCLPRIVLAEFNTHRTLSRNSASSRAIPVAKQITRVLDDPFIPTRFGIQQPGMQAGSFAEGAEHDKAVENWLLQRDYAVLGTVAALGGLHSTDPVTNKPMLGNELSERISEIDYELGNYGARLIQRAADNLDTSVTFPFDKLGFLQDPLHKQIASRPLEAWMWQTIITTGTEWSNFFALRNHPMAQPEIMLGAKSMQEAYESSTPNLLSADDWHLPIVGFDGDEDLSIEDKIKVSAARCARVSYLTHGGQRDVKADLSLYESLYANGHMSPLEHPARPQTEAELNKYPELDGLIATLHGNFRGFHQHRKDIPSEGDFGARLAVKIS